MAKLEIHRIPALKDNYLWLIREPERNTVAVVDPAEAEPVEAKLAALGWRLTHILNTHHHRDHTGGNLALKDHWHCTIVGPRADRDRIPGIDIEVGDGDIYEFGAEKAEVFDIPGHTRGHIAYFAGNQRWLFCGDTLFAGGCGRLFEGTPQQMVDSLDKLAALPGETKVYCAHEYTLSNLRFACEAEPGNAALLARLHAEQAKRDRDEPTVPSTIALEKQTNPFLRFREPAIADMLIRQRQLQDKDPVAVFTALRQWKNVYR